MCPTRGKGDVEGKGNGEGIRKGKGEGGKGQSFKTQSLHKHSVFPTLD